MTPGDRPVAVITGAAGYIGGHVVAALRATTSVRAVERQPAPWIDGEVVALDLVTDDLAPAVDGAGVIIHLAGLDEVRFAAEPDRSHHETVRATERVVDAARAAGATRLVYVSTVHVYGAALSEKGVITEDTPTEPTMAYAAARLASERIALGSGLEVVVLRLSNAVGPPVAPAVRRWTLVANDLCRQATRTGELRLRTAGTQWRDFIGMEDVCRAIGSSAVDTPPGTYNVAAGEPRTILDLAYLVQDAYEARTGRRPPLHAPEPGPTRPEQCIVENLRLVATGWARRQPLRDAIMQTVDACLEWKDDLRE